MVRMEMVMVVSFSSNVLFWPGNRIKYSIIALSCWKRFAVIPERFTLPKIPNILECQGFGLTVGPKLEWVNRLTEWSEDFPLWSESNGLRFKSYDFELDCQIHYRRWAESVFKSLSVWQSYGKLQVLKHEAHNTRPLLSSISNNKTHIFSWLFFFPRMSFLFDFCYIEQERTNKNLRRLRRCNHSFNSIKYRNKHLISTRSYFK